MRKLLTEFKEFAIRGNVVDMAVGIVVGGAFTSVVQALVNDFLMPVLGIFTGGLDFSNRFIVLTAGGKAPGPYASLSEAQAAGANVLTYGHFIEISLHFVLVAWALFFFIRWINRLKREPAGEPEAVTTKECSYCKTEIALSATRCPACTSKLEFENGGAPGVT